MIHVRSPQPLEGWEIKPDMECPTLCMCLSDPNKTETPQIGMKLHNCKDYIRHHCGEKWMLCIQHRTRDHWELYHSPPRRIFIDLNMHPLAEMNFFSELCESCKRTIKSEQQRFLNKSLKNLHRSPEGS